MNEVWSGVITIATAIVGVAILAVLVSQRANTANVITAGGNAFSNALSAAEAPVTGSSSGLSNTLFNGGNILGGSSLSGGASSVLIQ